MNIAALLHVTTERQGDDPAFCENGETIDFALLGAMAGRAALQFDRLGISNVVFADHGSSAFPIALFGAAWAGIPFIPVDSSLHQDDLRHLVSELRPVLLIGDAGSRQSVSGLEGVASVLIDEFVDGVRRGDALPVWRPDPQAPAAVLPRRDAADLDTISFSHRRLCQLATYVSGVDQTPGERLLIARPVQDARTTVALLASVRRGRSTELDPEPTRAGDDLLAAIEDRGITHLDIVSDRLPSLIAAAQRAADRRADASGDERGDKLGETSDPIAPTLTEVVVGDRPLPASILIEAAHVLGARVEYGCGLAVTGVAQVRTDAAELVATGVHPHQLAMGLSVVGSSAEVRSKRGVVALEGRPGDLYLSGPLNPAGDEPVWRSANLQVRHDSEGWITAETNSFTGEEQFHPELIEVLETHDEVCEVSAVAGAGPTQLVVVLEPDATITVPELQDWARQQLEGSTN